jgi:predicted NUDIX family NTP pyrophosphohydrolase
MAKLSAGLLLYRVRDDIGPSRRPVPRKRAVPPAPGSAALAIDTGPSRRPAAVEVLIAHPGGPFWARKDDGVWSIPKGEYTQGEDPWAAA